MNNEKIYIHSLEQYFLIDEILEMDEEQLTLFLSFCDERELDKLYALSEKIDRIILNIFNHY